MGVHAGSAPNADENGDEVVADPPSATEPADVCADSGEIVPEPTPASPPPPPPVALPQFVETHSENAAYFMQPTALEGNGDVGVGFLLTLSRTVPREVLCTVVTCTGTVLPTATIPKSDPKTGHCTVGYFVHLSVGCMYNG